MKEWASKRLQKYYGFARNDYETQPNGDLAMITRNADGSTSRETIIRAGDITRAGTESMSGAATYGYLIKPEFYGTIYRFAIENSVMEPFATTIPVGPALELWWPAFDQYQTPIAGQSAAYAGVQLFRKGEITQRTYSDAKLSQIQFKITDLTGFTPLSRDLLMDNYIAADAMIQELFGMAFAWKKDYEFIQGTGIGQPQGFFGAPALIQIDRTVKGTAGDIQFENLTQMLSALHPSCWQGSHWITNVTTIPTLLAIKNHAGAYVYQPNALMTQAMQPTLMSPGLAMQNNYFRAQGTLLGFPLFFSEKVPILGQPGDLNLVHGKSYGIASREGLEIGLSEHFLFDTDQISFRFKLRNDGKPLWRSYYQQADGSNTKVSPFIQLK
jgi:HK97 family phage major capsid protein